MFLTNWDTAAVSLVSTTLVTGLDEKGRRMKRKKAGI